MTMSGFRVTAGPDCTWHNICKRLSQATCSSRQRDLRAERAAGLLRRRRVDIAAFAHKPGAMGGRWWGCCLGCPCRRLVTWYHSHNRMCVRAAGNLQQQAAATGALGALLAFSPGDESGVADAVAHVPGAVRAVAGLLSGTPLPLRTTAAVMLCNLSRAPGGQQARTQPMPPAPVLPPALACPRTE